MTPRSHGPPNPREVLTRPAPSPDALLRYGPGADEVASVWLPSHGGSSLVSCPAPAAPTVMFLHGGFWRAEWDRSHAGPLAAGLADAGFTVCVPEFRRVGAGGGWPATFTDIARAMDVLPGSLGGLLGMTAVSGLILAGHSAGGHLALWAAARQRLPVGVPWRAADASPVRAVVGLAAVSDLTSCHDQGLGDGAAGALIGGPPLKYRQRYAVTDPARLLPLGVPIRLLHGTDDDHVPVRMSRGFAASARAAGDDVALHEIVGCEHFALIDPKSSAWPMVLNAFMETARL